MTFPCPQPENYAAVAKQLHDTALRAESAIYDMEQQLRSAVNRPTLINTTSAPYTDIPASADQTLSPTSDVTFANYPMQLGSDTVYSDQAPYIINGEGIYEVGMAGTVVPQGAIFVASHRTFKVRLLRPDLTQLLSPAVFVAGITTFEPGYAAGMDFSYSAIMRIKPFDTVQFLINHGNTSDLTLNAGAIFWMQKVSDIDITRVVQ